MILTRIINHLSLNKIWNNLFKRVDWYNLRSTEPVSRVFGLDRGKPVDRYYIEKFLLENKKYIRGKVLEIAESTYSRKFGEGVTSYEVLHVDHAYKGATITGSLTEYESLPENEVDCFICTQTLNVIYDFKKAIKGIHHILKKEGTALVTVAGLCQISRYDMDRWGDYWRFTTKSASESFKEIFGKENVAVSAYGNLLASVALLEGISAQELKESELDFTDQDYQNIITIVAKKKYD